MHFPSFQVFLPFRLNVVGRFGCLDDPGSYAGGDLVPGGLNRAGQVMGEGSNKFQRLALWVGEWAIGLCPIPVKKISLQKPVTLFKIAGCLKSVEIF